MQTALTPEKRAEAGLELRQSAAASLALPNHQHAPAQPPQGPPHALVALAIALQLGDPIVSPRSGNAARPATVHVPETAADVDDLLETRKNHVGVARQR